MFWWFCTQPNAKMIWYLDSAYQNSWKTLSLSNSKKFNPVFYVLSASPPWLVLRAPDFVTATQTHMDNFHKLQIPSSSWKGRFLTAPIAHIQHGGWRHIRVTSDITMTTVTLALPTRTDTSRLLWWHHGNYSVTSGFHDWLHHYDGGLGSRPRHGAGSIEPPGRSHAMLNYVLWEESNLTTFLIHRVYPTARLTRQ